MVEWIRFSWCECGFWRGQDDSMFLVWGTGWMKLPTTVLGEQIWGEDEKWSPRNEWRYKIQRLRSGRRGGTSKEDWIAAVEVEEKPSVVSLEATWRKFIKEQEGIKCIKCCWQEKGEVWELTNSFNTSDLEYNFCGIGSEMLAKFDLEWAEETMTMGLPWWQSG